MAISTYDGVVEYGQIRLRAAVVLPENATVYVVVPERAAAPLAHIASPRLAKPEQAARFAKQVIETTENDKF